MNPPLHRRGLPANFVVYGVLGVAVLLAIFPFLYMVSLSLQSDADLYSGVPVIIPSVLQFSNYVDIWERAPFARFVLNSFIIAGGIPLLHLIFDPLIGYVFAKMEFPGKKLMFAALLSTLMLPFFIRMIPLYLLTAEMGWLNSSVHVTSPKSIALNDLLLAVVANNVRTAVESISTEVLNVDHGAGTADESLKFALVEHI